MMMWKSRSISLLSFILLSCLMLGCGNPSVDCEIFVNDTRLLEGIVDFTPAELTRNNVVGRVENGKIKLVDNVRLQPGKCKIVLKTTKKAILGDESFTPTHKASIAETVVLEKKEFDVPDGAFELRFESNVKPN